jgi:hypothetical protein
MHDIMMVIAKIPRGIIHNKYMGLNSHVPSSVYFDLNKFGQAGFTMISRPSAAETASKMA